MAALMKKLSVASGRRFERIGVVKADYRIGPNLGQQWRGRAVEQQSADRIRLRGNMLLACLPKRLAKL